MLICILRLFYYTEENNMIFSEKQFLKKIEHFFSLFGPIFIQLVFSCLIE